VTVRGDRAADYRELDRRAGRDARLFRQGNCWRRKAASLGLPLHVVELPWAVPERGVRAANVRGHRCCQAARGGADGVSVNLFLEDIRAYRQSALAWHWRHAGVPAVAGGPTARAGPPPARLRYPRGLITCVDPAQAPAAPGRTAGTTTMLLNGPARCSGPLAAKENGEFHTFVVDGPGFAFSAAGFRIGETRRTRRLRLHRRTASKRERAR